jgi:multidrug resistance protein, MATE family
MTHCVSRIQEALFWPSSESFKDWGEYFSIATPAVIMMCAEFWAFEILIVAAGYIGVASQAAQIIMANNLMIVYMVPGSAAEAVCAMVGFSIGANNPELGKQIYKQTFAFTYICCMVILFGYFMCRIAIATTFSADPLVQDILIKTTPLLCLMSFIDSAQGIMSGAVRGLGRQMAAVVYVFGSYYLIGLPVALICAFYLDCGLKGLWYGMIVAVFIQALSFAGVIMRTDWKEVADKATKVMEDFRKN